LRQINLAEQSGRFERNSKARTRPPAYQPLYIQELLAPVFIGLQLLFMPKNGYFRPEKHRCQRFKPFKTSKKAVFKLFSGII
jgi:hypothetical protein